MNNIAFYIGTVAVHWFGFIMVLAILAGLGVSVWQAKFFSQDKLLVACIILCCVPFGLLFSRLYFVVSNWTAYSNNGLECFRIWHGGLAIPGTILGVLIVIVLACYIKKISFWRLADLLTPGFAITLAIGQWGNFLNQEAFGYPTNARWGIYIDYACRPPELQQYDFFHPTCLYESGLAMLIFFVTVIINIFYSKKPNCQEGNTFLIFVFLYTVGRFFIETLRVDSEMFCGFRLTQIFCLVFFTVIFVSWLKHRRFILK